MHKTTTVYAYACLLLNIPASFNNQESVNYQNIAYVSLSAWQHLITHSVITITAIKVNTGTPTALHPTPHRLPTVIYETTG